MLDGAAICILMALASSPAAAITAKDVMDKMSRDERVSYMSGLVDMLSYHHVLAGSQERAKCVADAFYRNDAVLAKLWDALGKFPDKAPQPIVYVVMKQACGG